MKTSAFVTKKHLLIVCALIVALVLTACGGSSSRGETKATDPESTPEQTTGRSGQDGQNGGSSREISIPETVVLDDVGIKITVTGFEIDSFFGPKVKFLIENNSDKNLNILANDVSVNGYMVDGALAETIAAGKKANSEMFFKDSDLEDAGIETITDIGFSLYIFDDNFDEYYESEQIVLYTSAAGSYTQTYDDSGYEAFNNGGIRLIVKGLRNDSFFGPELLVYIENNTDKNITVQVRNVSVNDYMVSGFMSDDVLAGKKAIGTVRFFDYDLEENNIENINNIELSFHIFDKDNWQDIADTDVIALTF